MLRGAVAARRPHNPPHTAQAKYYDRREIVHCPRSMPLASRTLEPTSAFADDGDDVDNSFLGLCFYFGVFLVQRPADGHQVSEERHVLVVTTFVTESILVSFRWTDNCSAVSLLGHERTIC